MKEELNFLIDDQRRYKIMYVAVRDFLISKDPIATLGERLGSCEPGTTIAKIFYDLMRQAYGLVLFNVNWDPTVLGEELPRYTPPTRAEIPALTDQTIIDVEFDKETNGTHT